MDKDNPGRHPAWHQNKNRGEFIIRANNAKWKLVETTRVNKSNRNKRESHTSDTIHVLLSGCKSQVQKAEGSDKLDAYCTAWIVVTQDVRAQGATIFAQTSYCYCRETHSWCDNTTYHWLYKKQLSGEIWMDSLHYKKGYQQYWRWQLYWYSAYTWKPWDPKNRRKFVTWTAKPLFERFTLGNAPLIINLTKQYVC